MQIANTFLRKDQADPARLRNAPTITLDLAARRRSRQLLTLESGQEVGLAIPRGAVLRDGDALVTEKDGYIVVRAAQENVLRVTASSSTVLTRAAYHLGNRHVLLEIGEGYLQLEHDPVLADMLEQLGGVQVAKIQAPFEPDVGAYGGGHRHGHDESFDEDYALAQSAFQAHGHGHDHPHGHSHGHAHPHDHAPDEGRLKP